MNNCEVKISSCKAGDILAKSVVDRKGLILAAKNTILNDFILSKLKVMGIETLWILNAISSDESLLMGSKYEKARESYQESVLSVKLILNDLAAGKPLDFNVAAHISETLYQNIENSESFTRYLMELKNYDDYTYTHCVNVAFFAMLIAKWMRLPKHKILEIIQAGALHDIGKMKIPGDILNKCGKLTSEELQIMKAHTTLGYEMLKKSTCIEDRIKDAVLMHHERLDGSGYPSGTSADNLGEYAKIIAVADVYDAMTSDRPYRKRMSPFEAFHEFIKMGASAFDFSIVKAFLLNFSSYLVGTKVRMNNGDIGEIVYVPPHDVTKPVIRINSTYLEVCEKGSLRIENVI